MRKESIPALPAIRAPRSLLRGLFTAALLALAPRAHAATPHEVRAGPRTAFSPVRPASRPPPARGDAPVLSPLCAARPHLPVRRQAPRLHRRLARRLARVPFVRR